MATPEQIAAVRRNADEPTTDTYSDDDLNDLIDSEGVAGATGTIWTQKAAKFASLVDITEGSSSRKNSQKYEHARQMAAVWGGPGGGTARRTRIHDIVRESSGT